MVDIPKLKISPEKFVCVDRHVFRKVFLVSLLTMKVDYASIIKIGKAFCDAVGEDKLKNATFGTKSFPVKKERLAVNCTKIFWQHLRAICLPQRF